MSGPESIPPARKGKKAAGERHKIVVNSLSDWSNLRRKEGHDTSAMKRPGRLVFRLFSAAIRDWRLIDDGDRILVGVSGGKDSLLLAWLLADVKARAPVHYDLSAVTIDLGLGQDFSEVETFLSSLGIPYHVEETRIAEIVRSYPTRKTACSLCANLRRGALYAYASKTGFNKVALGHHLDDAIETLFLNMFYQGNLRCFHPRTYLSRTGVTIIRPLVYIEESDVQTAAKRLELPVVPAECPVAGKTRRQTMKELTATISSIFPGVRGNLRRVLKRIWSSQAEGGAQDALETSEDL
ncbi:MAG: tRNA 2-thiocytidine(32) synthetase TtcA [Firmicutes bacterium]|nr:tRNA 2-thiocytidine(32) synthetase TtcA [Candidatus Fermentithermobacillaceae bacterium]